MNKLTLLCLVMLALCMTAAKWCHWPSCDSSGQENLTVLSPTISWSSGPPASATTTDNYYNLNHASCIEPNNYRYSGNVCQFRNWNDLRPTDGISPSYLADDCRLVADARERRLRSTASRTCVVTRIYSTFSNRVFAAAGSTLWNSLPSHLKEAYLL